MEKRRLFPIGIQTFSELIKKGFVYIDKTEYIYRMTHMESSYVFLGRPRRFGKSLLTSTLYSYFAGEKELFSGLAIEKMETEWNSYPVLHFDMSLGKHMDREQLVRYLNYQLERQEKEFGLTNTQMDVNNRLTNLIVSVSRQTGKQVVVLIDEYDAPLLDVVHEEENLPKLRDVMRNFYSPLKACDPYLRFVFLTGITKFSQLSIFCELNNIKNISMLPEYAAVCGITEEEMVTLMGDGIDRIAANQGISHEEVIEKLKYNYDGYHFTWPSPDVYNPFSLMNAFADGMLNSYWFGSGTPTYLIEMLNKYNVSPSVLGSTSYASAESFDAPTERLTEITPLLYQSGYITIKGYDPQMQMYSLDIPNNEVRLGLMKSLLPEYVDRATGAGYVTVAFVSRDLRNGDMDAALNRIKEYLGTVPYCDNTNYEGHYQQLLYIIFSILGQFVDVEVRTPRGRVDMVIKTATTLYVMEIKLDGTAEEALAQIDEKDYPARFALSGLPVVKVGINFDSSTRNIDKWIIA